MDIVVRWAAGDATEYISVNLESFESHPPINRTREIWRDETVVDYVVESQFENMANGSWCLTLRYDRKKNSRAPTGARFGVSTLTFHTGETEGRAKWADFDDETCNGRTKWKALSTGIFKTTKKTQKTISIIDRRQQEFRRDLKGIYGECAITKERSLASLEAAHVIPSRSGGPEHVENGILLRADIHRLYDGGEFNISRRGDIVVSTASTLSKQYLQLLTGKRLPDAAFKRVKRALADARASR